MVHIWHSCSTPKLGTGSATFECGIIMCIQGSLLYNNTQGLPSRWMWFVNSSCCVAPCNLSLLVLRNTVVSLSAANFIYCTDKTSPPLEVLWKPAHWIFPKVDTSLNVTVSKNMRRERDTSNKRLGLALKRKM